MTPKQQRSPTNGPFIAHQRSLPLSKPMGQHQNIVAKKGRGKALAPNDGTSNHKQQKHVPVNVGLRSNDTLNATHDFFMTNILMYSGCLIRPKHLFDSMPVSQITPTASPPSSSTNFHPTSPRFRPPGPFRHSVLVEENITQGPNAQLLRTVRSDFVWGKIPN